MNRKIWFLVSLVGLTGCHIAHEIIPRSSSGSFLAPEELRSVTEQAKTGDLTAIVKLSAYYSESQSDGHSAIGWNMFGARLNDPHSQWLAALSLLSFGCSKEEWNLGLYWLELAQRNGDFLDSQTVKAYRENRDGYMGSQCPQKFS
jgi:hypothetical protein